MTNFCKLNSTPTSVFNNNYPNNLLSHLTILIIKDDAKAGIRMEIIFKRRLTNELLTTYLPTFLLLGITFSTTFYKPFFFEAALTVNLTVMLVITTLFIRKAATYH